MFFCVLIQFEHVPETENFIIERLIYHEVISVPFFGLGLSVPFPYKVGHANPFAYVSDIDALPTWLTNGQWPASQLTIPQRAARAQRKILAADAGRPHPEKDLDRESQSPSL